MRKKKHYSNFTTSIDQGVSDELMEQISRYVPFETPSSVLRVSIFIILAIGLDTLVKKGVFDDKSDAAILDIAKTLRGEIQ